MCPQSGYIDCKRSSDRQKEEALTFIFIIIISFTYLFSDPNFAKQSASAWLYLHIDAAPSHLSLCVLFFQTGSEKTLTGRVLTQQSHYNHATLSREKRGRQRRSSPLQSKLTILSSCIKSKFVSVLASTFASVHISTLVIALVSVQLLMYKLKI